MTIFAENRFDNRYQTRNTCPKTGSVGRQYNVAGPRDFIVLDFSSSSKNSGGNSGICNRNSNISNNSEIIKEYDQVKSSDVDCIKEVFNLRRFNIIVNRKGIIVPIRETVTGPHRYKIETVRGSLKRNQSQNEIENFLFDYTKVCLFESVDFQIVVKESLKKTMLAIFIRTDAATDPEIISTEFLRSVLANFGEKPILIIHHHSNPDLNLQHQTFLQSSFARHVGIVHCKDDGQTLPNGNSIFIHNFCRAFNSYDDFSGPVLIFLLDKGTPNQTCSNQSLDSS